jgi:hypothetical protein
VQGITVFPTLRAAEANGFTFYEETKSGIIYVVRTNPINGMREFAIVRGRHTDGGSS